MFVQVSKNFNEFLFEIIKVSKALFQNKSIIHNINFLKYKKNIRRNFFQQAACDSEE